MPTKTRLPKVSQYVKNVGKSVAFASIEGVKSNMPGLVSFSDANREVFRDLYGSAKNYRESLRNAERDIKNTNIYKAAEYGVKNMIEDARTGNFYNKSREKDIADDILGLDDDFDYGEFSSSSDSSASKTTYAAMDSTIGAFTIGTTTAVAKGTDALVKSNRASTTFIASQIERSTATLHTGLGSVYKSVNQVNAFLNGPLMTHLENSRKYQEASLRIMQDQQAMMREMLEMQRNLYSAQAASYNNSKLDDIIDYNGVPNLKAYAKNVKGNISNTFGLFGLSDMLKGGSGTGNPLMAFAAAPFSILMDTMVGGLTPKSLKRNMQLFDKALTSMFSNVIARLNKGKNGGSELGYILGSIFGIDVKRKETIDTSKYNKGAVAFDGITRKTIVEVIPGYLARIESALTGMGERHYDPHKGIWKSAKTIERDFNVERNKHIQSGNSDIERDLRDYKRKLSPKDAESLEKSLQIMMTKIFEDGGVFSPNISKSGKRDRNGRAARITSGNAWKEYGFKSKAQFEAVLSQMSDSTFYALAGSNMRARNNWARTLEQHEANGGAYNILFNGAYDASGSGKNSKMSPSSWKNNNILTMATDKTGSTIFDYLREIAFAVNRNRTRNKNASSSSGNGRYSRNRSSRTHSTATAEVENSGDSDGDPDGDSAWTSARNELEQEEAERNGIIRKGKFSSWVRERIDQTPAGKQFSKMFDVAEKVFEAPIRYTDKLLAKANENLFAMMFGNKRLIVKDENGKDVEVDNLLDFIAHKINNTFDSIMDRINKKFVKPIYERFIKPYAEPVWNQMKSMGKAAYNRVGKALNRTIFDRIRSGGVASAEEIENGLTPIPDNDYDSFQDDEEFYNNIIDSAYGRVVTKRGLTMISPGEIIIPASFDKRKQRKMLALEKRDRSRIMSRIGKHIGLNAEGTVNTDALKRNLTKIYNENKDPNSMSKTAASGIMGMGAGLIAGVNPLLAAAAGAGLSILSNSDTLQSIVFGEMKDGEREGGLIPKSIQDAYKKYMPDVTDFGITGGVLGLFSPFGVLGGAAIGAGIGFLKNNESFKKFIFGDEANNEEGLISRESWDKFKGFMHKAAPKMGVGAVAAVLTGPFGLLGNAAMGAGIGMLTTTDTFHDFLFNEDTGMLSAFKNGVIDPATQKFNEILTDFKEYAKRNIINPMKDFWTGFNNMLKTTIVGIRDGIADKINDTFEKLIGLPLHDFMQEKIFKPVTKLVFGVLKAPLAVGKAIVAAPFRTLGWMGNNMTASAIRKGRMMGMTASERLAWRDQHNVRFNRFNAWKDKTRDQDLILSEMTDEQVASLMESSGASLSSYAQLQRNFGNAKNDISTNVSKYFNATGKNRFGRVKYNDVNKLTKMAQNGDSEGVKKMIEGMNLSDEEKTELSDMLKDKISAATRAGNILKNAGRSNSEMDSELEKLLNRKVKGRSDRRQIFRNAEAELKNRQKASNKRQLDDTTNAVTVATDIVGKKLDAQLKSIDAIAKILKKMVNPNEVDTDLPSDANNSTDTSDPNNTTGAQDIARDITANRPKTKKSFISRALGKIKSVFVPNNVTDEDSKEAVEAAQREEAERKNDEENTESNKKSLGVLHSIKEALLGKENGKGGGVFGWLKEKTSKIWKWLGIGALTIAGIPILGYASEWIKTSVWPGLKNILFGTKDADGNVIKEGLIGKIGEKINWVLHGSDGKGGIIGGLKWIAFGEDGKSGLLGKIKGILLGDPETGKDGLLPKAGRWISEKLTAVKEWLASKGGLPGIIEGITPTFIRGVTLAVNNVGAPLVSLAVKTLVAVMPGLVKALWNGIKMALPWGNKTIKNGSVSLIDSSTLDAIDKTQDSINAAVTSGANNSALTDLANSLRGVRDAAFNVDTNVTFEDDDSKAAASDTNSGGVLGALGQTRRTNEVVFDADGNPISGYTQMNTTDSLGSTVAKAAGRNFLQGLAGSHTLGTAIANGSGKLLAKGAGNIVAKPGVISTAVGAGQMAVGATKALVGSVGVAGNAGTAINSALNASTQYVGKYLKNSADDLVGAAAKNGILSGIKNIFSNIASSKIVTQIAKCATMMTSKAVTEAVVKNAIEKIGEKLAKNFLGRLATSALTSLGSLISKFSPLQLVMFVTDFLWGFNNAYTVLGVANDGSYNVNFGVKCVCGIVNMLTNFFTLGLLPANIIMDIAIEFLFPIFNIDASSLNAARNNADNVLDEWNKAHPEQTYDNIEDYNNRNKWTTKAWNGIKNLFSGGTRNTASTSGTIGGSSIYGSGRGGAYYTSTGIATTQTVGKGRVRSGRAHIYQSGILSNIPYGDSTIGEAGCAPVAAANILNGLGRDPVSSVIDAASYAERNGMTVPGGGTDISYFNSYLGSKGIPTKNTSNRSDVMSALRNGNQVVMLGQDNHNGAFGSEPHFVTAKGLSRRGNIIVEDPDLPNSSYEYNPSSVTNSMITSVIADVKHRNTGRARIRRGRGMYGKAYVAAADVGGGSTKLYASAVVNVAKSQEGVNEIGQTNDVKYNSAFYGRRVSGSTYAWPTVFVWWCFNQAGANGLILKTSSYTSMRYWFKETKKAFDKTPKLGDVIFLTKLGSLKNITGIVVGTGTTITYIVGDYGYNGQVTHQYINKNSADIEGFGHPAYPYTYNRSAVVSMGTWGDKNNYENIAKGISTNITSAVTGGTVNISNGNITQVNTPSVTPTSIESITAPVDTTSYASTPETTTEVIKRDGLFAAFAKLGKSYIKSMFGTGVYDAVFGEEDTTINKEDKTIVTSTGGDTTSSGGDTPSGNYNTNPGTTMPQSYNTIDIWNALKAKGYTNAGAAGIMGNMNAESSYRANNLQDTYERSLGLSDEGYSNAVSNGSYPESKFVHDSAGYGLVQFTYHTLKQSLYNHTVKQNKRVDNLQAQIDALSSQLSASYPSLNNYLKTTTDVVGASDKFLVNYENPAVKNYDPRRNYSWQAYNTFASGKGRAKTGVASRAMASVSKPRYAYSGRANISNDTANITESQYIYFLKAIIDILSNVSTNTAVLYKILEILSERFDINIDRTAVSSGERNRILSDVMSKMTDNSTKSKIMNSRDNDFLIAAMTALAAE